MKLKIGNKVVVKNNAIFVSEINIGDTAIVVKESDLNYFIEFKDDILQRVSKVNANDFIKKEVGIYSRAYDYDDMKIALCIQDFLDNDNPDMQINFQDFEDIIELAIRIRKNYDKCNKEGTLTKEEQGYIQQFAYNYLKENYGD